MGWQESWGIYTDPTITSLSVPLATLIFSCKTTKSPQLNWGNDASSYFISGIGHILYTATDPSDSTFHQGLVLYLYATQPCSLLIPLIRVGCDASWFTWREKRSQSFKEQSHFTPLPSLRSLSHFTPLPSLYSLPVNLTGETRFKIEGLQDTQRSVTDQGSEVGARNIPAFATRDDSLVGVQALILSAKEF